MDSRRVQIEERVNAFVKLGYINSENTAKWKVNFNLFLDNIGSLFPGLRTCEKSMRSGP